MVRTKESATTKAADGWAFCGIDSNKGLLEHIIHTKNSLGNLMCITRRDLDDRAKGTNDKNAVIPTTNLSFTPPVVMREIDITERTQPDHAAETNPPAQDQPTATPIQGGATGGTTTIAPDGTITITR
jgi:hypothetical protein